VSSASEAENEMEENEDFSALLFIQVKNVSKNWTLNWPWLENCDDVLVCNPAFHCVDCNCAFHFLL
jgi:hypothetical protein